MDKFFFTSVRKMGEKMFCNMFICMKCSDQLTSSHPKLVLSPKLSALTSDAYILVPGNENQDIGIYS